MLSLNPLVAFFSLAYVLTWGLYFAADATVAPGLRGLLFYLGVFTPGLLALWLTRRADGSPGVVALLQRLVHWRVPARWYVFALAYMATIKLTVALLYRAVTGAWPPFGDLSWSVLLAATLGSTLVGGQVGEELGWRGYALPRLAMRFGLGGASLLLGVLWAGWHLPLFFILGGDTVGQSFPLYVLQVTALSVAMAWLYARTQGSLLLTMLLHAAVNNTKDIVPSAVHGATEPWVLSASLVAWLTVILLWIAATFFLVDMRKALLAPLLARQATAA
jgi:membrane protease YdiL (CAAX protease family)